MPSASALSSTVSLFAVLANPLRLRLLVALARAGELSAGELGDAVGGEQSAVSHQLAILRRERLVAAHRDGRRMIYSLVDDHVVHIVEDAITHANERRSS
jgi:DNA-binding transcriptional ArsR family regulator